VELVNGEPVEESKSRPLVLVPGKAKREAQAEAGAGNREYGEVVGALGGRGGSGGGGDTEELDQDEREYEGAPMISPGGGGGNLSAPPAPPGGNLSAGGGGAASAGGSSVGHMEDAESPLYFDSSDPAALLSFVQAPASELAGKIKCEIKRDKKGMGKGSYPVYYLRLERPNQKDPSKVDKVFLLAGRKRTVLTCSSQQMFVLMDAY
jgi:hypothetical protein